MALANINLLDFLKEGSGVTFTLNGNVLTIASSGGGATTLDGLTDVVAPTPADNEVLTWDSGTSKWVNQAPSYNIDGGVSNSIYLVTQLADGGPS